MTFVDRPPRSPEAGRAWLEPAIGYGFLLLGVVLMIAWRIVGAHGSFFARQAFERVDPAVASGAVRVEENPTA